MAMETDQTCAVNLAKGPIAQQIGPFRPQMRERFCGRCGAQRC
jgi:hypothetical protein